MEGRNANISSATFRLVSEFHGKLWMYRLEPVSSQEGWQPTFPTRDLADIRKWHLKLSNSGNINSQSSFRERHRL